MSRPNSLTEKQQKEIIRRSLDGEGSREISKAMKIPETTVRRNIVASTGVIKRAANQIVSAERDLLRLPLAAQVMARDYMANLRAISDNLTRAAVIGSENAVKLSEAAQFEVVKATMTSELDAEAVKMAIGLTRAANDSAQLGVQLIQANKDKQIEPPKPVRSLDEFYAKPGT